MKDEVKGSVERLEIKQNQALDAPVYQGGADGIIDKEVTAQLPAQDAPVPEEGASLPKEDPVQQSSPSYPGMCAESFLFGAALRCWID